MGDYGIYIWPAYGLVLLGMFWLLVSSVFHRFKIKRRLMNSKNQNTR